MIVLPNTPPLPVAVTLLNDTPVSASISLKRLSVPENPLNYSDCIKYTVNLEEYIDIVFQTLSEEAGTKDLRDLAALASKTVIFHGLVPWRNVVCMPKKKGINLSRPKIEWTLASEIGISLVSSALSYSKLGANLINELIQMESQDVDPKWKSVTEYYKKALGILDFAARFAAACDQPQLNPILVPVLEKVFHIGVQLSILCKSSWMNRTSFETHKSFSSSNNGVLCRVAIWIMNEMLVCQNLFKELESSGGDGYISLNCEAWLDYSEVFSRYVTAYSGLFLSIEYYQKGELGPAIGLVHFALLSLQVKSLAASGSDEQKNYKKLKDKLVGKKHHNFISNLHSLTALKIDKSVFRDSAGVVLNDLSYLFDQLVYLRLKYTKENDNLRFEPVSDWKDIKSDTRWPMGTRIPISGIQEYSPKILAQQSDGFNPHFKGQYF